jgi:hypothetical protein
MSYSTGRVLVRGYDGPQYRAHVAVPPGQIRRGVARHADDATTGPWHEFFFFYVVQKKNSTSEKWF